MSSLWMNMTKSGQKPIDLVVSRYTRNICNIHLDMSLEIDKQFHFLFKLSYLFNLFHREAYQMEKLLI